MATNPEISREKLSGLLDEVGYAAVDVERDRNEEAEKVYEARKKAIMDLFFEPRQQINLNANGRKRRED